MMTQYCRIQYYFRSGFYFSVSYGVKGAALATVISQGLSALWILRFLTSPKSILRLKASCFRLKASRVKDIVALGMTGFTMSITNCLVQIMYNASLQKFGGDLYVGVMTVVNSVRQVIQYAGKRHYQQRPAGNG